MNGKYKLVFTRGHTVDGRLDNEEGDDPSTDIREVRRGLCLHSTIPKYTHEV